MFKGIFFVAVYSIFSSAKEVFVGNRTQEIDPFFLVFCSFFICAAFFILLKLSKEGLHLKKIKNNIKEISILNCTTVGSWLCFFYALKYLEPALVSIINTAIGPVITILLIPKIRPSTQVIDAERWSSYGILLALILLMYVSITGQSSIGVSDIQSQILGLLASFICGVSIVLNTVYVKKLSDMKWTSLDVLSTRFVLLLVISFFFSIDHFSSLFHSIIILRDLLLISILGVIVPLYFLQKGIELLEPITIALLLSFSPAITYFMEILDSRLELSFFSGLGILIITFLVIYSTFSKYKYDSSRSLSN